MGKYTKGKLKLLRVDEKFVIAMGTRLKSSGEFQTIHEIEYADCVYKGEADFEEAKANAKRIVEIWNACAGLSKVGDVKELVEACKAVLESEWMVTHDWGGDRAGILSRAKQALSKFEVEK